MRTLYQNLTITDKNGTRPGRVLTEDGMIIGVFEPDSNEEIEYERIIDCKGLTMMPGFIDTHSHLRDPGYTHKEDLLSGLSAAAKGGYTRVCAMANTKPVIDSKELVKRNKERAKKLGGTELIQVSALTKDFKDELVDFESIIEETPIFSNDGYNVDDETIMREALKKSEELGFIVATHNEPETETVKRDIKLLRENGGHLHICHISKADTLEQIAGAKKEGLDITCEVTPHHIYASEKEYPVHPPFRLYKDKRALIKGIREGIIDTCGSDHAPHTEEEKRAGAPGINNYEAAFGLYNTVFEQNKIDLSRLSEMLSFKPAQLLSLKAGLIETGYPADLVFVSPEEEWELRKETLISKSENTPFHGDWLTGRVHRTLKDGRIIYDSGEVDFEVNLR